MNIWQVFPDVDNYWWCIFKATEKIDGLDFITLFSNENEDKLSEILPDKTVFYNKDRGRRGYRKLRPADIMKGDVTMLVNEKSKCLIENKYSEFFRFFSIILEDLPNEKYYIIIPLVYLELSDYLDMENTEIKYLSDDKSKGIYKIRRYVFLEKTKGHHLFRLMYNNGKSRMFIDWYCDDEFKDFIEENNITGLKFTKIFEFKD